MDVVASVRRRSKMAERPPKAASSRRIGLLNFILGSDFKSDKPLVREANHLCRPRGLPLAAQWRDA